MKLKNSEILLLTQVLYHIKCVDGYLEAYDQVEELHKKLCSFLLNKNDDATVEEECVWHEEESADDDELENENHESIELSKLLLLDATKVKLDEKKFILSFEHGTSKSILDINLDDGDEIISDVIEIQRNSNSFEINCNSGWLTFEVQKFPKTWTSLLKLGICYKVV